MHVRIQLPEQSHTLACVLRSLLFENGATEAACVVLHPQDTHLTVDIRAEDCFETLRNALLQAKAQVATLKHAVATQQHQLAAV